MNATISLFSAIANLNRATAMTRLLRATTKQNIMYVKGDLHEMYIGVSIAYNKDENTIKIVRDGKIVEVSPSAIVQTDVPAFIINIFINEESKANAFSENVTPKQVTYKLEFDGTTYRPLNRLTQFEKIDLTQFGQDVTIEVACASLMTKLKNNNELTDGRKSAPAGSIQAKLNKIAADKRASKK